MHRGRAARASRVGAGFRVGLVSSAAALAIAPAVVRIYRSWQMRAAVSGDSMLPALRPGDWLLVDPDAFRDRAPRAGDVVVVPDPRTPERMLVKRVRSTDENGRLQVAGDSAARSTDSRTFGLLGPDEVRGRAWARYWPLRRIGPVR
jgi:nickel-type superoxide dismutase maturation protease